MGKPFFIISFVFLLAIKITIYPFIGHGAGYVQPRNPHTQQTGGFEMVRLYKAVFHLDSDKEQTLILTLGNINNLFKEIPAQQCDINIVANGTAVKLFKKDTVSNHAEAIEELHKSGVHFKMCNNALAYNKISKHDLIDFSEIVPAGIVEIIDLQRMGFAYIKP